MTTMLIISMLMAVAYVAAVIIKDHTLPDSISALVYALPKGRWRWLWSLWLALVTLLMTPSLTAAMDGTWWLSLLADATVICLSMTAAMPLLPGYHNTEHNALGILAGVLTQACVAVICPWWLLLWLTAPFTAIAMYFYPERTQWLDGKGVFVVELICAINTYVTVLMQG